MPLPPNWAQWLDNVTFTAFAAFAGWMGYLMRTMDEGGKIVWLRSFLEAFSSGIIGFIVVLLCRAMGLSYEWMGVMAGVLGWLGAKASIQLLEKIVRKRLGIDSDTKEVS
jgi:hypothetical protein